MDNPHQPAVIEDKPERRTYAPLPKFQKSGMILQEALTAFTATVWGTSPNHFIPQSMRWDEQKSNTALKMEHFYAPVVHPVFGETIKKNQTWARYPVTKETWTTARGKEWENLSQGDDTSGTDALSVMAHKEIRNISKDRTVTYAEMVADYRLQKPYTKRVHITAGENIIKYPC